MALSRQASNTGQEFGTLDADQRLLSKGPKMRFEIVQVTVGLGLPPLTKPELVDVFEISFGGRGNNKLACGHMAQALIPSNNESRAAFDSMPMPSPRSS